MKSKILFIMYNMAGGGAEKVLSDILLHFDYTKYDVELALIKKEGLYLSDIPHEVKITRLYTQFTFYVDFGLVKFLNFHFFNKINIKKHLHTQYDTVISFMEGFPLLVHSYVITHAKKNISWVHTDLSTNHHSKIISIYGDKLERDLYKKMDEIIFVSQDSATQFEKLFNIRIPKTIIYNPIDRENIIVLSQEKTPKKRKLTIGTVGRLTQTKAYEKLIHVADRLNKEHYNIDFWILGEGKLKNDLERLVQDLCLKDVVFFKGFKKNPYPYMNQFDIFISTSIVEGFPLVICEALCLQLPIVATSTTGPREILNNGEYGILTEHTNESIYEGLKKLLDNEELRSYYSTMSQKRSQMFNITATMNEIYRILYK